MNLALVTELFHPSIGGQEVRFEELANELTARGHKVTLFTIHFDSSVPSLENKNGVKVVRLSPSTNYKHARFRRNPIDIIRFSIALLNRRRELQKFDSVIFNIWPILPQFLLGPFLKGKCVIDICETRSGFFWKTIYKAFKLIPKIRFLGVNPEIIRHITKEHGIRSENCEVIVSGVDIAAAGSPPFEKDPKQILFFGRMTEHKNPRLLAEAFIESEIRSKGFHLEIAGGGPELEGLKRDFTVDGITIHGRVSDEEKWKLLRQSSLLVMPSRREGFPRVVAEGACVGTPTLSLDFPDNGTCSVVNDYRIGKVCEGSKAALVDELKEFASSNNRYDSTSAHCLNSARVEFSWEHVTTLLIDFLSRKA